MAPIARPPLERFWEKVEPIPEGKGCWEWVGGLTHDGYGRFSPDGNSKSHAMAHRYSYEIHVGRIPNGLTLDHLCRNRSCVNPAHLEPVTIYENNMRGETATAKNTAKTHCDYGHAFDSGNTYKYRYGSGAKRSCNKCSARRQAEYRSRKKVAV